MANRILLVDDECHILHAAEFKFRRADFDVRTATDGEAAWEIIQEWLPDVMVTDCQMPYLDGLGLCQRCRDHERTQDLPILILSAKGFEQSTSELAKDLGVLAVIPKPFSPRELLRCVQQIVETGKCTPPRAFV